MYILGVNSYLHDSSAALLKDGKIIAFAEEERFKRDKHFSGFAGESIKFCLNTAGIGIEEVDHFAFSWIPWKGLVNRIRYMALNPAKCFLGPGRDIIGQASGYKLSKIVGMKYELAREFDVDPKKINWHFVEHHLAHAASAFYLSGFDRADILTVDAAGEWNTTVKYSGDGVDMNVLQRISLPNSLGWFYGAFTQYLGFKISCDEGKVMGLSSYGDDNFREIMDDLIKLTDDGRFVMDDSYFNISTLREPFLYGKKLVARLGPPRAPDEKITSRHEDIAASLQLMTDRVGIHLVKDMHSRTGNRNLCLAGGVALNSVMNGKILMQGIYKNIFVQPAAADNGGSLGAALYLHHKKFGGKRTAAMENAYWGPDYSREESERAFSRLGVEYKRVENIEAYTAQQIADGKIIGWFQGRMEIGPRALGNRSILADPRRAEMKDILNRRVKHRESFRPFAPSVLEECAADYFDTRGHSGPFMLLVFDVLPDKRDVIPAVTHVDGTGRVQTVSQDQNPRFWQLISEFRRVTGVPVIINTSFNIMGEPIVCTPEDAIRCFVGTGIDVLVIDDLVAVKQG